MERIHARLTVGSILTRLPGTDEVFVTYDIDVKACWKQSLRRVAHDLDLDVEDLVEALQEVIEGDNGTDWLEGHDDDRWKEGDEEEPGEIDLPD